MLRTLLKRKHKATNLLSLYYCEYYMTFALELYTQIIFAHFSVSYIHP